MNHATSRIRRWLIGGLMVALPMAALAQDYPNRIINMVVPFPPGGGTDIVGRIIAQHMGELLPSKVVVVNNGGAAGVVGTRNVMGAKPDGYTLLFTSQSIVTQSFETKGEVSHKNFIMLGMLNEDAFGIAVAQKAKWRTLEEFLNEARSNPGKVSIGTTGFGSATYMQIPLLEKAAKVKFNPIPYPGSAGFHTAVLAGHVDASGVVVGDAASLLRSGQIRLLGVMSPKRLEKFPDVPSYRELGIDVDFIFWRGLFVHKDTPPAIVKVLRDAVTRVANAPAFKAAMEKGNFIPAAMVSDADTQAFLAKEERMVQEVLANLASKAEK